MPDTAGSFGTSVALSNDGSTALVGDPFGGAAGARRGDSIHWRPILVVGWDAIECPGHLQDLRNVGGALQQRNDRAGR